MKTTTKVSHPVLDISIFLRENTYLIKIVLNQFEQIYRIKQVDVTSMDDVLVADPITTTTTTTNSNNNINNPNSIINVDSFDNNNGNNNSSTNGSNGMMMQ